MLCLTSLRYVFVAPTRVSWTMNRPAPLPLPDPEWWHIYMTFHSDTHATLHNGTHVTLYSDTHVTLHNDTHVTLHSDTHVTLHSDTHVILHSDTHVTLLSDTSHWHITVTRHSDASPWHTRDAPTMTKSDNNLHIKTRTTTRLYTCVQILTRPHDGQQNCLVFLHFRHHPWNRLKWTAHRQTDSNKST